EHRHSRPSKGVSDTGRSRNIVRVCGRQRPTGYIGPGYTVGGGLQSEVIVKDAVIAAGVEASVGKSDLIDGLRGRPNDSGSFIGISDVITGARKRHVGSQVVVIKSRGRGLVGISRGAAHAKPAIGGPV